jgi:hypothetical protein
MSAGVCVRRRAARFGQNLSNAFLDQRQQQFFDWWSKRIDHFEAQEKKSESFGKSMLLPS